MLIFFPDTKLGRDAFGLRYRVKSREVQLSVPHDKRELVIAPVRKSAATEGNNDFESVYRITKDFACGGKPDDTIMSSRSGGRFFTVSHPMTLCLLWMKWLVTITCGYGLFLHSKREKTAGFDGLPALVTSTRTETFPREWNKEMTFKILKRCTRFECDNWWSTCVIPASNIEAERRNTVKA